MYVVFEAILLGRAAAAFLGREDVDADVFTAMLSSRDRMDDLAFIPQEPLRNNTDSGVSVAALGGARNAVNTGSESDETGVQIHREEPAGGLGRDLKKEVDGAITILAGVLSPGAVDKLTCAANSGNGALH